MRILPITELLTNKTQNFYSNEQLVFLEEGKQSIYKYDILGETAIF